jgi:hypothetical protein
LCQHAATILLEELFSELGVLQVLHSLLYTGNAKQNDQEADGGYKKNCSPCKLFTLAAHSGGI